MIQLWWVFALTILTCLSYLDDTGVISFMHGIRVPIVNASLLSLMILLCMLGLLGRLLQMQRRGEKEQLMQTIQGLNAQLQNLKAPQADNRKVR